MKKSKSIKTIKAKSGNVREWFSLHYEFDRDDMEIHVCCRFGKVRRAYFITPNRIAHEINDLDALMEIVRCKSWYEAMNILRRSG